MMTIFGTKFSIFCSPQPKGILIRLARLGILGPSISPTAETSISSEPGTTLTGISKVTLVLNDFVFLKSINIALFKYWVSPSACKLK